LCEEDKTNATSIRYWFSLVDGDGDGYLRQWEIRLFYDEQLKRMKSLGHEEVTFHDVLCQMKDCLGKVNGKSLFGASPDDEDSDWVIGLAEFLKPDRMSISGSFFNLLFNLNKFVASESRDPFSTRLMQGDQPMTDWDRYALAEYGRLASAEEARGNSNNTTSSTTLLSESAASRIMVRTDESDSESDDGDDDNEDDEDEEQDEDEEPLDKSSEESGDFNTKGLDTSSVIFASAAGYVAQNDKSSAAAKIADKRGQSVFFPITEDSLKSGHAKFNISPLWLR
jgi:hypothetical protein